MNKMPFKKRFVSIFLLAMAAQAGAQTEVAPVKPAAVPLTFSVSYEPAITDSFTGRVYLMMSRNIREPRFGPSWSGTEPFFAMDVRDWKPETPLTFDDRALSFPKPLSALPEADYFFQAVMRRNADSPTIGAGEGSAHSASAQRRLGGQSGPVAIRINQLVQPASFNQTERIKLVELRSDRLSDFHHRDMTMRAAVILPEGYDAPHNKDRRYPALYWIGGFGNDHTTARYLQRGWSQLGFDDQIIRIILDPLCYGGHHAFADSDNNGPVGTALVQEFIPHLERAYRLVSSPQARFLSGHSSGGWASLWVQIIHPEFFGGTWSIAPDPVDFRDFQRIDLYKPGANMYTDESGQRRPLSRQGDQVTIWYDDFARMEVVHGEGGQLRSFEWVFSRRGEDGKPLPLYDRATGAVNHEVAESWKRYDIRLILEATWPALGPKLDNGAKLHVFMGDQDTFYLDGATLLLKKSQEALGSRAVIQIEPGKDHITIASGELRQRIDRELIQIFTRNHPDLAPAKFPAPPRP